MNIKYFLVQRKINFLICTFWKFGWFHPNTAGVNSNGFSKLTWTSAVIHT